MHARILRSRGEQPFDRLRDTRARVRRSAAALLLANSDDTAAVVRTMLAKVRELYVREPPFVGFDDAMIDYTAARTWQHCARELDPTVPEIQRRWE